MRCVKCGHEIMSGAAFCPYCGEKAAQGEGPVYQADVKKMLKSGKLIVYRDRTEFVTSSVQKAVFNYTGLVAVKKEWDHIDFITEDGRRESCPADRKCVHEAFLHIEQMVKPYLDQRKDQLLSQGVRYSIPSSQGFLNDGVLNISAEQAEFRAKSGKSEILSFQEVRSVRASANTLDFSLYGGRTRSFAVSKELRDEMLAFVTQSIAPFLAQRKRELLAQGIYFSFYSPEGGTVEILADRVEYRNLSGQTDTIPFQSVRAVSLYAGTMELGLTTGASRSLPVEEEESAEALAFVEKAIEPYVRARTEGFDISFGIDEQIEINEERGVFHILRQGGKEITDERPLEALTRCEWVESKELNALGSMVSGSIALFKSAAKAAGSQTTSEAEDWISCAGAVMTVSTDQGAQEERVWFGLFTAGMSRLNKKFDRYLEEWTRFSDYLKARCPECELVEPVLPEPEPVPVPPEAAALPAGGEPEVPESTEIVRAAEAPEKEAAPVPAARQDDLGIAKYIDGVSRFIGNCATPMTIAFQGNRGSGKSSILGMLFDRMEDQYGENALWLNGRQLPQNGSGEELSLLVGKKLMELLTGEGITAKQTGTLLTGLAGLATGLIVKDISLGKEIAGGMLTKDPADHQEDPVTLFSKQIEAKTRGKNEKVIFFVDGLDQLAPARAVELLEAMRDFFDCKGCVFVIAADHASILSGVRERYGQGADDSKGKRFFDELFKMSFRVPASSYNMDNYVRSKLERMGVQVRDGEEQSIYVALLQTSVGRDLERIDHLFMSFQLLKDMVDDAMYESGYKRLALFALLCMQTRFRDVYDYVVRMKDSVTPQFLSELCGGLSEPWGFQVSDSEKAAFRDFGGVFARIIDQDGGAGISEAECRAFAEVLEFSSITSR